MFLLGLSVSVNFRFSFIAAPAWILSSWIVGWMRVHFSTKKVDCSASFLRTKLESSYFASGPLASNLAQVIGKELARTIAAWICSSLPLRKGSAFLG